MHGNFQRRRPIAEMNMIPLIDVSLILVIIFMVLTPVLVQHEMSVQLPSSQQGESAESDRAISLQIDQRGRILLDGKPVKLADLDKELGLVLGRAKQKTVLVQADKSVSIQSVVEVLDAAKRLKVGKLGIGVLNAE